MPSTRHTGLRRYDDAGTYRIDVQGIWNVSASFYYSPSGIVFFVPSVALTEPDGGLFQFVAQKPEDFPGGVLPGQALGQSRFSGVESPPFSECSL